MTAHLTISYGTSTPAASPTSSVASAAGSSPAGDGSLGFLAALIDQLLAGSAAGLTLSPGTAPATGTPAATGFAATVDPTALATAQATPQGLALLTKLTKTLATLKSELDAGDKPDPDLLKKLGDTADALAALIAVPAPTTLAATPPSPAAADPLAAIGATSPPVTPGTAPVVMPATPGDSTSPQHAPDAQPPAGSAGTTTRASTDQDIARTIAAAADPLAALVAIAPAAPAPAVPAQSAATAADPLAIAPAATSSTPATPQPSAPALPGIAQLTSELADLSKLVAASAPVVSRQLDTLVQKLGAAQANPQALAQLTTGFSTGATSLDRTIQQLLGNAPATAPATPEVAGAAPQLATPQLPLPGAPAAPASSTAAKPADPSASPSPSTAADTTAPTITLTPTAVSSKAGGQPSSNDQPKQDEVKLLAAATATESKSDKTDPASTAANAAAPTPPAVTSAAPRVASAAYQSAQPTVNIGQVAFEMARQVQQGASRFTIRLDPPDLGRIDVKMHVDATGNLNARLTVERSETLDMFQRDRGSLEKALTQAGVDGGKTNLEFSLKQNPFAGMTGGDQRYSGGSGSTPHLSFNGGEAEDDTTTPIPAVNLYRGTATTGGVNLFV